MNHFRVNPPPNEIRHPASSSTATTEHGYDDSALEGVAANIKLLLKLTQDHKTACLNEKNGSRRMLRVATMMTILDNIRARIQKCQSFGNNRATIQEVPDLEKEQLKREQKNLQAMCSSLGKEKQIMASELYRKVQELNSMEELVSDLKAQNESLLKKVKDKRHAIVGSDEEVHERNKVLSENLLKSLGGYRSMKRKLKAAEEENGGMREAMDEMRGKIVGCLERVLRFKEVVVSCDHDEPRVLDEEIEEVESMLECFRVGRGYKCDEVKQGDCVAEVKMQAKGSSVLA